MATLVRLKTAHEGGEGGRAVPGGAAAGPARALERALRREVAGEVRFDAGARGLYARDASNYRQVPIGVVLPRGSDDVLAAVRVCREHGAPILARGGGTSLAGQCCNVAVVLDFSKYMNRVLEVDPARRIARVQPGCVLDDLRAATREYGLTFGPDPATHSRCTLGGMIGNDSCGVHSVMSALYGPGPRTEHNVEELVVVTYDGELLRVGPTDDALYERIVAAGGRRAEIYRGLRELRDRHAGAIRAEFPDIPRRVSGYNLPALLPEEGFDVARALVGTESTCAITLEATVKLMDEPRRRSLLVLGYPSVYDAADHVPEVMEQRPIGLEGMDDVLIEYMRRKGLHAADLPMLPEGRGWLLVEFGGADEAEAESRARALMERLRAAPDPPSMRLFQSPAETKKVWEIRESGLGATAFVPGEQPTWPGWEDAGVPPDRVGEYLRDFRRLIEKHGYDCSLYGHFGQGCIHTRVNFELGTRDGVDRYLAFIDEAADLVVSYGGSLSGEHGDGQARAHLWPKMFGPELLGAFRDFKRLWDPGNGLNPNKLVALDGGEPHRADQDLALGPDYRPRRVETHFAYAEDGFSFEHATIRCVGVGKCRRHAGGTMCPSYMVTREERHSTRGRARLLNEMLRGEVIPDGWRSEEVRDALDLCLACKGCKSDCPVDVDVATYKAEFLAHHYAGRLRPRAAYAMGLVHWWARAASLFPALANRAASAPVLSGVLKRAAGIAPERALPRFARRTFRDWFRGRVAPDGAGPTVLLWPDTFSNFFRPEQARAAVEVLEAAGFRVRIPDALLCCGRPLYDYGFLDRAKTLLRDILDELRDDVAAGVPVVGLEPSCVATFRDELPNLFPHDEDAARLSRRTFMLGEFLDAEAKHFELPRLTGRALVHGHCHHTSVLDFDPDLRLLRGTGLELDVPDSGCCGMAGSFGFEAGEKYEVSQACGERVLLPRVRDADDDVAIVANGFSCGEQIAQGTGRRARHLAEVLHEGLAREQRLPGQRAGPPLPAVAGRAAGPSEPARIAQRSRGWMLLGVGVGLLAGAALARASRNGSNGG